jgi:uncharacterized coiled-coil protein SlyX
MSDLVERLRESAKGWEIEAADRIEELEAQLDRQLTHACALDDEVEKRDLRIAELEAHVEALQNKCARRGLSPEDSDALQAENERLTAAIIWALGYTDFGCHKPDNAKPFWWRKELRERSGITNEQALAAVKEKNDE